MMADLTTEDNSSQHMSQEIYTSPQKFLQAIHRDFLELVYPIESQLVDELRSHNVFQSDDEETICAGLSRRDRARTCWQLLGQVPASLFEKHCYPALKTRCSMAVGRKVFSWDGWEDKQCLRHLIQKTLRLKRFADVFPGTGGCSQKEYRQITEGRDTEDSLWDMAFTICRRNKDNTACCDMMKTTLSNLHLPLPDNFQHLMASGFSCTCDSCPVSSGQRVQKRKSTKKTCPCKKVRVDRGSDQDRRKDGAQSHKIFHLKKVLLPVVQKRKKSRTTASSCSYPSTVDVSAHGDAEGSESVSSQESRETTVPDVDDQDTRFESDEQKGNFLDQLELINNGIRKAVNIKAFFREITGIEEELNALREKTKSETNGKLRVQGGGKIHRLQVSARNIKKKLQDDYKEASSIKEQTIKAGTNTELCFKHRKTLLNRRHVLVRELNEAEAFFNQCLPVCEKLCQDAVDQPAQEFMAPVHEIHTQHAEQESDDYSGGRFHFDFDYIFNSEVYNDYYNDYDGDATDPDGHGSSLDDICDNFIEEEDVAFLQDEMNLINFTDTQNCGDDIIDDFIEEEDVDLLRDEVNNNDFTNGEHDTYYSDDEINDDDFIEAEEEVDLLRDEMDNNEFTDLESGSDSNDEYW